MKKLITTLAVALVSASVVHADTIAAWNLSGNAGTAGTQAATTTGSGVTAGSLVKGAGLPAGGVGWVDAVASYADWQISSSLEYAVSPAGSDYFSFTVTPNAGQTASYDNIYSRFVVNAGNADTEINFTLMSSQTGFTTNNSSILGNLVATELLTAQPANTFVPSLHTIDVDVSGVAALQNVATATEFRIYAWKNYGGNRIGIGKTWSGATGDDLVVSGSVIPEPATLGLLGFASAGLILFRRRFSI